MNRKWIGVRVVFIIWVLLCPLISHGDDTYSHGKAKVLDIKNKADNDVTLFLRMRIMDPDLGGQTIVEKINLKSDERFILFEMVDEDTQDGDLRLYTFTSNRSVINGMPVRTVGFVHMDLSRDKRGRVVSAFGFSEHLRSIDPRPNKIGANVAKEVRFLEDVHVIAK